MTAVRTGNDCTDDSSVYGSDIDADSFTRLVTVSMRFSSGGSFQNPALAAHGTSWWLPTPSALYRGNGRAAPTVLSGTCPKSSYDTVAELASADATRLDAVCVGNGAMGSVGGLLRGSTNGGATWHTVGSASRFRSDVTEVSDSGAGVLIVASASSDSEIARTADDGQRFRTVLTVAGGGIDWSDAGFTTTSQAFAVLSLSRMYLSRDAGATWQQTRF